MAIACAIPAILLARVAQDRSAQNAPLASLGSIWIQVPAQPATREKMEFSVTEMESLCATRATMWMTEYRRESAPPAGRTVFTAMMGNHVKPVPLRMSKILKKPALACNVWTAVSHATLLTSLNAMNAGMAII